MRKPFCVVAVVSLIVSSLAAAQRPEYDEFSASRGRGTDARATATALAQRAGNLAKPGFRIHAEPRLGVPTFVWGNPGANAAPSTLIVARGDDASTAAARAHLGSFADVYGLTLSDVGVLQTAQVHDTGRGPIIIKFRQSLDGIEIFREETNVAMDRKLALIAISGYVSSLATPPARGLLSFRIDLKNAATNALQDLTLAALTPAQLTSAGARGAYDTYAVVASSGIALEEPLRIKKVYYHLPDGLEPAYYIEVLARTPRHETAKDGYDVDGYAYVVSALDGHILFRHDLSADAAIGPGPAAFTYRVWADPITGIPYDSPAGNAVHPNVPATPNGVQYPFAAQQDVTLTNYPFSRDDAWLAATAVETNGNNVDAFANLTSPDGYGPIAAVPYDDASSTGDFRAQLTGTRQFLSTHTPDATPATAIARQGAIQQLFYDVNFLHDWFYDAGFDEASGNAQNDNYGRGGVAGDAVRAQAQDSSGRDNANMLTPADGSSPRMRQYLFANAAGRYLQILTPPSITAFRSNGYARYGAQSFNVTGDVVAAQPADGCSAFTNAAAIAGRIALIDTDGCSGATKAENAQAAGAIGVLIANVTADPPPTLDGTSTATLPILTCTRSAADAMKSELAVPNTVTVRMYREPGSADRDGTVDNQIVFHEWAHYLTNRLIGNSGGLWTNQSRGMGEGWSDFNALLLTARADDTSVATNAQWNGAYAVGTYVASGGTNGGINDGYYYGIRRAPYSTDMTKNPLTLRHIQNGVALPASVPFAFGADGFDNAEVHSTGEVWASMLWECYAALLRDTQGASPRLTFNDAQQRMKTYLVASLKLTPVAPTFIEARDALLAAAYASDIVDYVAFWQAFAKRGAGLSAAIDDRFTFDNIGVTESYTVAPEAIFASAALNDGAASCDSDGVLDSGERGLVTVTLRNIGATALGHLTGTIATSTPGVSFPDGNMLTFPPADPLGTVTAFAVIALAPGITTAQSIDFQVNFSDPLLSGSRNAAFQLRANTNTTAPISATDTVEADANSALWTTSTAPPVLSDLPQPAGTGYSFNFGYPAQFARVAAGSALQHRWHADDLGWPTDLRLTSPLFTVNGSGSFSLQFDHQWTFESDAGGSYDGGVVEISVNGGAWTDFGGAAYNGHILPYAGNLNPLTDRDVFTGTSAGLVHTTLTQSIATAATVQVRFRVATDGTVGAPGWDIDNIAFGGVVETPFRNVVDDPGCTIATTTILTPSANPSPSGSPLVLTATVSSAAGAPPNGGTVTFFDGSASLGTATTTAGVATFTTSSLVAGAHILTARYGGSPAYVASTSPAVLETIGKIATNVALTTTTASPTVARPVTFVATVSATSGIAAGSVTLFEGAISLGISALTNGVAIFATSSLATGVHNVTAIYGGNATFGGATSGIARVTVNTAKSDLTGEGRSDIVLQNANTSAVSAWNMNGSTLAAGAVIATPGTDWKVVATGDLDGDGKADLIVQNTATGTIALWRMNGLSLLSNTNIATVLTTQRIVGTYDFNHDGKADILVQNTSTNLVAEWQMNGSTITAAFIIATPAAGWRAIAAGNSGGDAIILQNTSTGAIARWLVNGFTITVGTVIGTPSAGTKVIGIGDFNLDGIDDVLLQHDTTKQVTVWRLNASAGVIGNNVIASPATVQNVVGAADYDANGRADILLQNSATGAISMWQTDGATLLSGIAVATPAAGWKPIVN
jgi:hypothetical protein